MHRVDLTGAFQNRVVGTAHTWLMAVNSSLHCQEWFHRLDRSSYFWVHHFHNVGRSYLTDLSNIQYDNIVDLLFARNDITLVVRYRLQYIHIPAASAACDFYRSRLRSLDHLTVRFC